MDIGDPVRTIIVEPAENPVPQRERQTQPARRPEPVIAPDPVPAPTRKPVPAVPKERV